MFHFENLKLNCYVGEEVGASTHLGRSYLQSEIISQFTLCLYDLKGSFAL